MATLRFNDSKLLAFAISVAFLTACSSRTQSGAFLPPNNANPNSVHSMLLRESGDLLVRVTIARSVARGFAPAYISPSTKGMTVDISGPTSAKKTVGLTLSSAGCKSTLMSEQCILTIPLKACPTSKSCYVATVATYDAYKNGKIPKRAHKLSADQNFAFAITAGSTVIPLTLDGIPRSVVFVPSASSSLAGSMKAGFVEPKCKAKKQTVSVFGVDADGNYIVGAGAPGVSLKSSDAAQFKVEKSAMSPNDFVLAPPEPPAYPFGNHVVELTTTAIPAAQSGASRVSGKVKVVYSGDICGVVKLFSIPTANSGPREIAAGPDGNLWFSELDTGKIARSTTRGKITEFPLPGPTSEPYGITAGPDGNIWFTEAAGSNVGRITPAGAITEFPTKTATSFPTNIVAGPDGNLWFAEQAANNIARISTQGTVAEFGVPTASSAPFGIAVGPDGNMWFTEYNTGKIGVSTLGGVTADFPTTLSFPGEPAAGPDGALWIPDVGSVARATTSGVQTSTYPLLTPTTSRNIVSGPDGALWFAEFNGKVGRVTVSGNITDYPGAGKSTWGISNGPDGAIWFTDDVTNQIGRLY